MLNSYHENVLSVEKSLLPVTQSRPEGLCLPASASVSVLASAWDTVDPEWSRRDKALLRDAGRDTTPRWEPTTTDSLMHRAWPSE